jgi:hypothetical protein
MRLGLVIEGLISKPSKATFKGGRGLIRPRPDETIYRPGEAFLKRTKGMVRR